MPTSLSQKTALVTGSTDGLGKLIAVELAKQGANVIVHGRSEEKVQSVIEELKKINADGQHTGITCDFNTPSEIEKKFSGIAQIDILINNAGVWLEGNTVDSSLEKIHELVHVNLVAPLLLTRVLLPVLKKADFAQILNVSSIAGVEIPVGYYHTVYSATKFGVQAFSEALAKEFDNTNVRVMGYYPGGMDTKLFAKAGLDYKESEPWMFDPQESVDAIVFMLTRSSKINVKRMDLINYQQS
jgi:short-subunit dehydrogenase